MKLDRFINRPVLSTVISIVIVILGVLGLLSLPISQYPDIAPPTVRVNTTYQGDVYKRQHMPFRNEKRASSTV